MTSPWNDLTRPPLSAARLRRAFHGTDLWREVQVIATTPSTNSEVATAARAGAEEGLAIVAEHQSAGRGRLDRDWQSPPRAAVLLSALLRPQVGIGSWPLLPLLAGLAVMEAVLAVGQVDASLKWPNDLMVDGLKLGGILTERVEDAVVVGIGLNVSTRRDELPTDTSTSLGLLGGATDREILVKEVLRALARRYLVWQETAGAAASVIPAYRERCETIGYRIDVHLPGGEVVRGLASGVDDGGRLLVRDESTGNERAYLVGDVTHVRKVS